MLISILIIQSILQIHNNGSWTTENSIAAESQRKSSQDKQAKGSQCS